MAAILENHTWDRRAKQLLPLSRQLPLLQIPPHPPMDLITSDKSPRQSTQPFLTSKLLHRFEDPIKILEPVGWAGLFVHHIDPAENSLVLAL